MIEKPLAGPFGVYVKFSTLQEYGVDRVFFLENNNVDTSQRNVVFLARGEKAEVVSAIAGETRLVSYRIHGIAQRMKQTLLQSSSIWKALFYLANSQRPNQAFTSKQSNRPRVLYLLGPSENSGLRPDP